MTEDRTSSPRRQPGPSGDGDRKVEDWAPACAGATVDLATVSRAQLPCA